MPIRRDQGRPALHFLLLAGALTAVGWMAVGRLGARDPAVAAAPSPSQAVPATAPGPPEPATPPIPPPRAAASPSRPASLALRTPITDLDPETRAALEARLAREYAAQQRFEQGLETSRVRPRDIDARVRDAFQRVELEPELLDSGLIRGLRIRSVEGGSVFGEAGFQPGDILVKLDGRALEDPAELPDILGRMGPRPSVCARRGPEEFCRDLALR